MKHINTFGTWSRINEAEEMEAPMEAPMDAPEPGAAAAPPAKTAQTTAVELPKDIETVLSDTSSITTLAKLKIQKQGLSAVGLEGPVKDLIQYWGDQMKTAKMANGKTGNQNIQSYLTQYKNGQFDHDLLVDIVKFANRLLALGLSVGIKNNLGKLQAARGTDNLSDKRIDDIADEITGAVNRTVSETLAKIQASNNAKKLGGNWLVVASKPEHFNYLKGEIIRQLKAIKPSGVGKVLGAIGF